MPSKCGFPSCFVYSTHKDHKLFRIPAVRSRGTPAARQQMIQRRSLWATSCGLDDPPAKHILICSRHFVSGKPAQLDDVTNIDWVPSLNLIHQHPETYCSESQEGSSLGATETVRVCCVPVCVNQCPEWMTNLPNDRELQNRWLMAIQIGSGLPVAMPESEIKWVCNMHFAASTQNGYREPTLFVRDNLQIQLASCRLCLNFDIVDNMFNMKLNLRDGPSLQWMVKAYFGQFSSTKEYVEQGFFCERCTVQIDMTHSFCRKFSDNAKKYQSLLDKMANEKIGFGRNVAMPTVKKEQFILPKPSPTVGQPLSSPKKCILSDSNEANKFSNIDANSSKEMNIPLKSDPNHTIKTEFTAEEHQIIEPDPPSLINPPPPKRDLSKQILFKCYLCEIRQESKNSLIHHLMMDHQDHKSLHCAECNVTFQRITEFNKHLGMHDPSKRLKCAVCPLRFRKTSAKVKHESARHSMHQENQQITVKDKIKKNQCSQCDKAFVYISELSRHEKFKHQGVVIARCEICNKSFASGRNLTRHLKLHRGDEKPPNLTSRTSTEIRCNLCMMAFQVSKDMVTHLEEVHPEAEFQTYPCSYCEEVFFSPTSRTNHKKIHSDIHACEICGKRHYSKLMLQRHRQSKHAIPIDEDQFRDCPICGRLFIKGTDYLRHLRTHKKEKFSCETCGKKFREREQLRIHKRVHTHEKPMECKACGARFASPASLSRHKKICSKVERN